MWLKVLLQYFPVVLQGVVAVEQALHGAPGAQKKDVVLGVIQAGAQTAGKVPQEQVAAIGTLIDASVDALNKAGVFEHLPK